MPLLMPLASSLRTNPSWSISPCTVGRMGGDDPVLHEGRGEDRLVKFDFLGLKTLTVVNNTLQLIEKHRAAKLDLSQIL